MVWPVAGEDGDGRHRRRWGRRIALGLVGLLVVVPAMAVLASGVWPPFVVVASDSMAPALSAGDVVYVVEEGRFGSAAAVGSTGVATARTAAERGDRTLGRHGDVVLFYPTGDRSDAQFVHRAMFHVEAGENWYDRADPAYLGEAADCEELPTCPAPHAGFVTKGDGNAMYDQVPGIADVVRPEWVRGTVAVRVLW